MSAQKPARWRDRVSRVGSGYPPTIQVLVTLLLLVLPCGALSDAATLAVPLPFWRLATFAGLALLSLLLVHGFPIKRLRMWQQLTLLGLQCGVISAMQVAVPSAVSGYLFLAPMIQAAYLFGVWVWLPVGGVVWLAWGSTAMLAAQGWLDWIGANIYAIFLLLAVAVAAAVYRYQDGARARFESLLHQLQQQYIVARAGLEQVAHKATQEERDRLVAGVSQELRQALGQLEQLVNRTLAQAQASVRETQPLLNQTQGYVRETVETVRAALATLRPGGELQVAGQQAPAIAPPVEAGMALASPAIRRVLDWLPLLFGTLIPLWSIVELHTEGVVRVEAVMLWLGLVGCYLYTQWSRSGFWFHLGLVGQTCSLLAMVVLTQSSALFIGLALVAGQIALRCSWAQMVAGFVVLQGAVGLVVGLLTPTPWQIVTSLLLFASLVTALVVPIIAARRRFSKRMRAQRTVREVSAALAHLNVQAEQLRQQAVVAERHRVAREIHDGLGHYLMTITLQLHIAQQQLADDPPAALRQLQETQRLIGEAQRHLIHSFDALNPLPQQPEALRQALGDLVERYDQQGAMQVTLEIEGEIADLPNETNLALFRVAQEGLTNAARHGQASTVHLRLSRWPAQVQMVVADNGSGTGESGGSGLGLLGISERAALLGGWCDAGPSPEGGFVLRFEVPLTQAAVQ